MFAYDTIGRRFESLGGKIFSVGKSNIGLCTSMILCTLSISSRPSLTLFIFLDPLPESLQSRK